MHKLTRILAAFTLASMLSACNTATDSSSSGTTSTHTTTSSDSISLNWKAPSTRDDGSHLPVSELAGYRVYTGTTSDNMTQLVDLNDYTMTQYTVNNLTAGDHYFTVTSYDTDGVESSFSQIILVHST